MRQYQTPSSSTFSSPLTMNRRNSGLQSNAHPQQDDEELVDATVLLTPKTPAASLTATAPPLHLCDDADMQESPSKKLKLSPPPLVQSNHNRFVDRLVDFHASDSALHLPSLDRNNHHQGHHFHLQQRPTKARRFQAPRLQLRQRTSSEPNMASSDGSMLLMLQPRIRDFDNTQPPRQRSVSQDSCMLPMFPSLQQQQLEDDDNDADMQSEADSDVARDLF